MRSLASPQEQNTSMLLAHPGLAEGIALSLGTAIIIPKSEEDKDSPWHSFEITVDDQPRQFFTIQYSKISKSMKIYPLTSFSPKGLEYIFRHSEPPPVVLEMLTCYLQYHKSIGTEPECKVLE